jgi:tetraacyldisaccharide 4'-kinase
MSESAKSSEPSAALDLLLGPLAALYAGISVARNAFYDAGILVANEVGVPVVSIGNLTAGGTGKTPLVAYFAEQLRSRGVRVGIVSRGYGGTVRGPARVTTEDGAAARYGDEPSWYARRFPEIPVYVGADRVAAARELVMKEGVRLILADDAFQHRRLDRALDVLVVDATEPRWHYRPLPLGRLRESRSSLRRANFVVMTKCNLAMKENLNSLRDDIDASRGEDESPVMYEVDSAIVGFLDLRTGSAEPVSVISGKKVFLVSGIGRPETFASLVPEASGAVVTGHRAFPDHHAYTENDLREIERQAEAAGADAFVVTEKDAIKLGGAWNPKRPCWISRLEVRPRVEMKELNEAIARLLL